MKQNILGVGFDILTREEALKAMQEIMLGNQTHIAVTPNPEIVMATRKDVSFRQLINRSDFVLSDGMGILLASRIQGGKLKNRVEGCDLSRNLMKIMAKKQQGVFLFGAKAEVVRRAAENLEEELPGLVISGTQDGYIEEENYEQVVQAINHARPHLLLVGLGSPRQEAFMHRYKSQLNVPLMIGVGGSIDVFAGELSRAPKWMRSLGLEWLHRLYLQPKRIKRMKVIPHFLLLNITRRKA